MRIYKNMFGNQVNLLTKLVFEAWPKNWLDFSDFMHGKLQLSK